MDEVPRLSPTEKVYVTMTERNEHGRRYIVLPAQKSLSWMRDSVNKFSKRGEIAVDLLSGTFPTAKPCLKLSRHRLLVVGEVDTKYFAASAEALMETYAKQVSTVKSDISGSAEEVDDCAKVVRALNGLRETEWMGL